MSDCLRAPRHSGSRTTVRCPRRMLGSGLCVALLNLHCGRTESTSRFQEKSCGEVSEVREPEASLGSVKASLKGVAFRGSNGGLGVTVAPAIHVDDTSLVPIDPDQLTLDVGGSALSSTVAPISADNPAAADVVFIIDTTRSMSWAIDGVAQGARNLRDLATPYGADIQFGGIEFGDGIRTRINVGSLEALESWLSTLVPIGGGDSASSALDAILEVDRTFSFRPHAVRHWVVISTAGYHESSDGSGCSDISLGELQTRMRPDTLLTLVQVGPAVQSGLRPEQVARTLGALYVHRGVLAFLSFSVSQHVPLFELLTAGVTGDIEGLAMTETIEPIGATYNLSEGTVTNSFEVGF